MSHVSPPPPLDLANPLQAIAEMMAMMGIALPVLALAITLLLALRHAARTLHLDAGIFALHPAVPMRVTAGDFGLRQAPAPRRTRAR